MKTDKRLSQFLYFALFSVALTLACSKGPDVGTVRGIVKLDGNPLNSGTIQLSALDGKTRTSGARIRNGVFEIINVPVSKQRVRIGATIVTSPAGTPNELLTYAAVVPAKYNEQSEIVLDVNKGLNEPVFDLKSK